MIRASRIAVVGLGAVFAFGPSLSAQSVLEWSGRFEAGDGLAPPELEVDAPYLTVTVVAHESDSVAVVVTALGSEEGIRRTVSLPTPALEGRTLRLVDLRNQDPFAVEIRTPRRTNVRIRTSNQGRVSVRGIAGDIEVENSNAAIRLEDVGGAVVAATSNGEIRAGFARLPENGRLSFLTSNASVTLVLPQGAGARLVLETDGAVETDFPLSPLADGDPAGRMGARAVRGIIGAGGPLIRVRTDNAGIEVLRSTRRQGAQ